MYPDAVLYPSNCLSPEQAQALPKVPHLSCFHSFPCAVLSLHSSRLEWAHNSHIHSIRLQSPEQDLGGLMWFVPPSALVLLCCFSSCSLHSSQVKLFAVLRSQPHFYVWWLICLGRSVPAFQVLFIAYTCHFIPPPSPTHAQAIHTHQNISSPKAGTLSFQMHYQHSPECYLAHRNECSWMEKDVSSIGIGKETVKNGMCKKLQVIHNTWKENRRRRYGQRQRKMSDGAVPCSP